LSLLGKHPVYVYFYGIGMRRVFNGYHSLIVR
jgi:hypothetical protein